MTGVLRGFWDQDRGGRNFGDALTAVLFDRFAGVRVEWAPPEEAELFGIGSALEAVPHGFTGVIFGTGKMFASSTIDLRRARVYALRGALSADRARATCDLLADPGLMAGALRPDSTEPDIALGWIPHYADRRRLPGERIDILGPVAETVALAARCRRIRSSSLHGLVLADALGIPSAWEPHDRVLGEGFKFRDYASGFGETIEPGEWRQAPPDLVERKVERLRRALEEIANMARVPEPIR